MFPPPLFKDIPKMGTVDSPFYRTAALGVPPYPGYTASLLHPPGLAGTPFAPPNHVTSFAPKVYFIEFFFCSCQYLCLRNRKMKNFQETSIPEITEQFCMWNVIYVLKR